MSITLSRNGTAVRTISPRRSKSNQPSAPSPTTSRPTFTEPRLQTAVSSELVTSKISVQRLERWITFAGSCEVDSGEADSLELLSLEPPPFATAPVSAPEANRRPSGSTSD